VSPSPGELIPRKTSWASTPAKAAQQPDHGDDYDRRSHHFLVQRVARRRVRRALARSSAGRLARTSQWGTGEVALHRSRARGARLRAYGRCQLVTRRGERRAREGGELPAVARAGGGRVRARGDTSLMNVPIASVVRDLDTPASSVQSAIALEARVSAAFILIISEVGDLFGRDRAGSRLSRGAPSS